MNPLPRRLSASLAAGGDGLSIVVIRLGALGDVVRTIPAVRVLRRAYPHARLSWVVDARWSAALEGHQDLDAVVELPRKRWDDAIRAPSRWSSLVGSIREFRGRLRETAAHVSLDFHGNLRSGVCGLWSGAEVRLGYDGHQQKEGNHWMTTHRVTPGPRRTPRMERNLSLVRALGLPATPLPDAALPLVDRGREEAASIAGGRIGGIAVICPGASPAQAFKKPPAALLAAAACRLAARGIEPLVVWGPGEEGDARAVVEASSGVARLAPPTGLATLAALLDRARLYVGGDTGPLHFACATGCPAVALYGPTDPVINRPWGVPHRAVAPPGRIYTGIQRVDRAGGLFEGTTTAHVIRAVDSLLDEVEASRQEPRRQPSA